MLLDYELIGDLQVSNGIVSGFNNSTNNYIKIPYSLPMGSNKVELCLSLYYPALSSTSTILANYNDSSSGGGLVLRTDGDYNNIKYWTWDSSGTIIADTIDLGFDLTIGTNIIKFVYENSTITWYKSTDGTSFTQGVSRSGTIADFQNYLVIGASGTVWSSGNMQVNMLDSYIKVNDEYWHSKEYTKQKTRIIQRHDTAANWSTINPILALGEMGVETDTNKFKFGDGTTPYNELPYAAGEGGGGSDAYTKAETDSLLSTKQDKLTAGDGVSIQLEGEEYQLTSTFPTSLVNNSVKLLENINTDYGVYMTLHCVNNNPPNFDIQLINRTDGANSTCGYIINTSNGYIAAVTINDSVYTDGYVTNILASDVTNIYIKMSIKPTTGYGTLEISTDNINFITVQEDTQPNMLNAQCWFKTTSVLTVNSVYAYKFPVYNYIKAKPDNTTIGFNSSGQLACKSNMLSDSNFIEFCTANADAIKAALGLS